MFSNVPSHTRPLRKLPKAFFLWLFSAQRPVTSSSPWLLLTIEPPERGTPMPVCDRPACPFGLWPPQHAYPSILTHRRGIVMKQMLHPCSPEHQHACSPPSSPLACSAPQATLLCSDPSHFQRPAECRFLFESSLSSGTNDPSFHSTSCKSFYSRLPLPVRCHSTSHISLTNLHISCLLGAVVILTFPSHALCVMSTEYVT